MAALAEGCAVNSDELFANAFVAFASETFEPRWVERGDHRLHLQARYPPAQSRLPLSRSEPELGAKVFAVCAPLAVAISVVAIRLRPRMPADMVKATTTAFRIGWTSIPIGTTLGWLRMLLGETDEVNVMVRAANVQLLNAACLFVMWCCSGRATAAKPNSRDPRLGR